MHCAKHILLKNWSTVRQQQPQLAPPLLHFASRRQQPARSACCLRKQSRGMAQRQRQRRCCFTTSPRAAAAAAGLFGSSGGDGSGSRRVLPSQGGLRFALLQSPAPSARQGWAAAPFASLSAAHAAGANPLFSLSRLTSGSSGLGSSEALSSGADSSSGGYSSDGDTGSSGGASDLQLDKINCQLCRKPLSSGGKTGGRFWQRGRRRGSSQFLVCDCCQQCFHEDCCSRRGISTEEGPKDGRWYHSNSCRECFATLKQQAASGAAPLPDGRSWQLVDCEPRNPRSLGGARALAALKQQLGDVLEVLLPAYGPGVAQQLVDTTNGYAVLLRSQGQRPVTAGLLDVYGQELAVLDVVATLMEEQGKGHCGALLGALEGWLGPCLGVSRLLAVCPDDEPETARVWQRKFGFTPIAPRELKRLQAAVPPLAFYTDALLLSKPLPPRDRRQQQEQQPMAASGGAAAAAAAVDS